MRGKGVIVFVLGALTSIFNDLSFSLCRSNFPETQVKRLKSILEVKGKLYQTPRGVQIEPILPSDNNGADSPITSCTDIDDVEFARQLSMITFEIYANIRYKECYGHGWSKVKQYTTHHNTHHTPPHNLPLTKNFCVCFVCFMCCVCCVLCVVCVVCCV